MLSPATKKIIMIIGISALAIMAGGAVLYILLDTLPSEEALPFALGVLLTSALNVFKINMLERTVRKTVDMEDATTGKHYVRLQYLLRYFLTAAVLLIAALTPFVNIWGAILGIFTLQIAIISVRFTKISDEENVEN